ncbi:MAG TPA: molybdenum cofactor synthesis domain-containing protein [Bacillota bacterium]|nr:molybdenum cofactor synthesis domain-containing protein [Bacillota bacterium]
MQGRVVEVCISANKGERKKAMDVVELVENHGIAGDAHAGPWHRQVSLLAEESIEKMRAKGLSVGPGDFAENITTRGLPLAELPVGTRLLAGTCLLRVTQIGKECHTRCAIYYQAGDCVMPREGIFVEVLRGGQLRSGDRVSVIPVFRAAVITLSDRCFRQEAVDESGPRLALELGLWGAEVDRVLLPDDADSLEQRLRELTSSGAYSLILTTGGTGMSKRDVTPEATMRVLDRLVPGISEAIRAESMKITPHAMLSRGVAGLVGGTLVVNLPGSVKGATESFSVLARALTHALEVLGGETLDCGR